MKHLGYHDTEESAHKAYLNFTSTLPRKANLSVVNLRGEIWGHIPGTPSRYSISNMGRMKTSDFNKTGREALLHPHISNAGYCVKVVIGVRFSLHRMVYTVFVGEIPPHLIINHKNRDRGDNRVENLELVTYRENQHHWMKQDRKGKQMGISRFGKRWHAYIGYEGDNLSLGFYWDRDDAIRVRAEIEEGLMEIERVGKK